MAIFNRRITVATLVGMEHKIQSYECVDDLMRHVHRSARMCDMMPGGWYDGYEAIYDAMATQFTHVAGTNKHRVPELSVVSDEDMGAIQVQIEIDQLNQGEPFTYTFREFDIVQKRGSEWMVMQIHVYVPIDPATGRKAEGAVAPRGILEWSDDPLPGPAASVEQGEKELEAWIHSRLTASHVESAIAHYGPGDDTVLYAQVLPDEHRGLDEIRANLTSRLAGVTAIDAEITDLKILTNGLLGGLHARARLTTTHSDGTVTHETRRHANLLRRFGDSWYSMIEMSSVPVDMRSGVPVAE